MKFIILGCGSSMGVPRPDGFFGNCDPENKKNYRTRCSALIKTTDENILIDTSPDLRQQLLRHKINKINKGSSTRQLLFYSAFNYNVTCIISLSIFKATELNPKIRLNTPETAAIILESDTKLLN
mgnify:CR=1 FL=1